VIYCGTPASTAVHWKEEKNTTTRDLKEWHNTLPPPSELLWLSVEQAKLLLVQVQVLVLVERRLQGLPLPTPLQQPLQLRLEQEEEGEQQQQCWFEQETGSGKQIVLAIWMETFPCDDTITANKPKQICEQANTREECYWITKH